MVMTIINKGFSIFDCIDVDDIIIMEDCINICSGQMDMFLEKRYVDILTENKIHFQDNYTEIWIESDDIDRPLGNVA